MSTVDLLGFLPGITILAIVVCPFLLLLFDKLFGTKYGCTVFGWHNGRGSRKSFDGCSVHSICSKCGKEVLQDSQGNWG